MTSARAASRNSSHGQGEANQTANATARHPATVGSKTDVGAPAFEREIRGVVACVLARFPTKTIEVAGDLTDEGVRLLKNQKRTLSVPTLLRLAQAQGELGPAMWSALCQLAGRPNGNPELESPQMSAVYGALNMLGKTKGPAGDFANALLRQISMSAAPIAEPEPVYIPPIVRDSWKMSAGIERNAVAEEARLSAPGRDIEDERK